MPTDAKDARLESGTNYFDFFELRPSFCQSASLANLSDTPKMMMFCNRKQEYIEKRARCAFNNSPFYKHPRVITGAVGRPLLAARNKRSFSSRVTLTQSAALPVSNLWLRATWISLRLKVLIQTLIFNI